jgi:DNA polymerase-3 subunit delta'
MASLISQVVGHDKLITNWLRAKELGRLAGVYLFVGPSGVGKKTTAIAFAQAYLCPVSPEGCGTCASCLKVEKLQSENLLLVAPQGQQIKTEQAQDILRFLSLKSWGGKRVVILDQVQTLHPAAANALLKTLEEPPEETIFFLIAPSASSVLPTLRSRCQVFSFYPVAPEEMKKKVKAPDWILRASRGSFEKLEQFQEESATQVRHEAAQVLEACVLKGDFLISDEWRDSLKEKGLWARYLMYWNYLVRDAIYTKLNKKDQILNTDLGPFLEKLAPKSMNQLLSWQEVILKWENELLINRDHQLQMESFYIQNQRGQLG